MIDDDLAKIVSENLNPEIPCLFLVDACHSGTVLDLQKGGIWGGLKVFLLSGCQDEQFSGDTGNGGVMTHALLKVLEKKTCKKKRKHRTASIQYVFNRMVDEMPQEEQEE